MAKYAFISDIHGNLTAFEEVLHSIDTIGVDGIICLGDVVGYGPFPGECLDLVAEKCVYCVQGNHDRAVIDETEADRFNTSARLAIEVTKDLLEPRHLDQIREMPLAGDLDEITVSHANPVYDVPTDYIHDQTLAAMAYGGFENTCLFVGHTHIPIAFGTPDIGYAEVKSNAVRVALLPPGLPLHLASAYRYILNPGSVGQPRDGNPDASFGILDVDARTFTIHRCAYDVTIAQEAILKLGLPNFLARRLKLGA